MGEGAEPKGRSWGGRGMGSPRKVPSSSEEEEEEEEDDEGQRGGRPPLHLRLLLLGGLPPIPIPTPTASFAISS